MLKDLVAIAKAEFLVGLEKGLEKRDKVEVEVDVKANIIQMLEGLDVAEYFGKPKDYPEDVKDFIIDRIKSMAVFSE